PDLLAQRLEEVEVRMATALDPRVVAKELRSEAARELALADAGRAVEEIRVRRALLQRGGEQSLCLVLLRDGLEAAHVPPSQSPRALGSRRSCRFCRGSARPACGTRRRPSPAAPFPRARAGRAPRDVPSRRRDR